MLILIKCKVIKFIFKVVKFDFIAIKLVDKTMKFSVLFFKIQSIS